MISDLPEDDATDEWTKGWCELFSTPPTLRMRTGYNISLNTLLIVDYKEIDFGPVESKSEPKRRQKAIDRDVSYFGASVACAP